MTIERGVLRRLWRKRNIAPLNILWLGRCTRRRWTSGRLCSAVRIYMWRSRTRTWRTPHTCTSTAPASSRTPGTSKKYSNSAWQRCPIFRIKWYQWWLIMILHLAFLYHLFIKKYLIAVKKVWKENKTQAVWKLSTMNTKSFVALKERWWSSEL